MSKMTLLEMVQNILSSMDSDEVNSIGDTVESLQVATEIKTTYLSLIVPINLPENKKLITLDSLGDTSRPNYLRVPSTVKQVFWLKYNTGTPTSPSFVDLTYVDPQVFIENSFRLSSPTTSVVDFGGVGASINTNKNPTTYTSFDDLHLVCDGYDSAVDDTLQASKTLAFVSLVPQFELTDTYVPDIDDNLFPLLLSEAKNACFVNIKQINNANEQQRSRRQLTRVQSDLYRTHRDTKSYPNYGRHSRKA